MGAKLKSEYVKEKIESYGCTLLSVYENCSKKIKILCPCGEEFEVFFHNFIDDRHSHRCPKCGFLKIGNAIRTDVNSARDSMLKMGYTFSDDEYVSFTGEINVFDSDGYGFRLSPRNVKTTISKGFKPERFSKINPHVLHNIINYVYIMKLEFIPYKVFEKRDRLFVGLVCCKCGFYFETYCSQFLKRKRCPSCSKKVVTVNDNLFVKFPEIIKEWDFVKNERGPREYRPFSNKFAWWTCSQCGWSWKARICDRTKRHNGCPGCHMSGGAKRIYNYLKNNFYKFCIEKEFPPLVSDSLVCLKYDFCIFDGDESPRALIEFDGEQHFRFVKIFHKNMEDFRKRQKYDRMKDDYAEDNNIPLLRISYDQIEKTEEVLEIFLA